MLGGWCRNGIQIGFMKKLRKTKPRLNSNPFNEPILVKTKPGLIDFIGLLRFVNHLCSLTTVLSDSNKRLLYDVGAYDSDDDETVGS